ncbi:MAG: cytochrome c family protein [Deltaproteobacteria bacterium]|nr:cytochrome c family protein [Deltaproteobacteria bacterium]
MTFFVFKTQGAGVQQPIAYNHQAHVKKKGEPCQTCHRYFEERDVAGRPVMATCIECHTNPVTKSKEEEKLRQMAEQQQELAWTRVTVMPDHVRFSHMRHVKVGRIDCSVCHGDMGELTTPPTKPNILINMNFCLDCHRAPNEKITKVYVKPVKKDKDAEPEKAPEKPTVIKKRNYEPVTTDCIACHR